MKILKEYRFSNWGVDYPQDFLMFDSVKCAAVMRAKLNKYQTLSDKLKSCTSEDFESDGGPTVEMIFTNNQGSDVYMYINLGEDDYRDDKFVLDDSTTTDYFDSLDEIIEHIREYFAD